MQEAFGYMIWIVVSVSGVLAAVAFFSSFGLYDQIGRGGLSINDDDGPRESLMFVAAAPSPAASAERDAEIRQMLEGRNARRIRRGQAPLDIDAEVARLTAPAIPGADPQLEAEVREFVMARNRRRIRKGQAPLDVESEVARQLASAG